MKEQYEGQLENQVTEVINNALKNISKQNNYSIYPSCGNEFEISVYIGPHVRQFLITVKEILR